MRGRAIIAFALVVICAAGAGCVFKRQPFKGVVEYVDGKVYLRLPTYAQPGRFYRVGILPDGWERMATRAHTISFYNEAYRCSISTSAYCGLSVSDRSLDSFTGDMVSALEDRSFSEKKRFMLDGRGALRQRVYGKYNGVPTVVDLVTARKGGCVFDFYLVSQAGAPVEAREDFETFFGGFEYAAE